jgi:hypothetical protein
MSVLTGDGAWVSREYSEMESATRLKEATKTHLGQLPAGEHLQPSPRISHFITKFEIENWEMKK